MAPLIDQLAFSDRLDDHFRAGWGLASWALHRKYGGWVYDLETLNVASHFNGAKP